MKRIINVLWSALMWILVWIAGLISGIQNSFYLETAEKRDVQYKINIHAGITCLAIVIIGFIGHIIKRGG